MPCVALALIPIALVSMYLNDSAQKDDAGLVWIYYLVFLQIFG